MTKQELKELITPEFLSTLHSAVECCGWDVDAMEYNIGQPVKPSGDNLPYPYISSYIHNPKQSNWTCYMFGGSPGCGMCYTPPEGRVPNRFVRFMMRICFDCMWVEEKK
jgi:hypothetical protein